MFVKQLTDGNRVKVNFIYFPNQYYWFVLVAGVNDFDVVVNDSVQFVVAYKYKKRNK